MQTKDTRLDVQLRPALPSESAFIAEAVLAAMGRSPRNICENSESGCATDTNDDSDSLFGDYDIVLAAVRVIAGCEDTLYSYRNAYILTCNGVPAGCIIGYNGAFYAEMAETTFSMAADLLGVDEFNPGTETQSGEYYLDSLYVSPEFRGHKFGSMLIRNQLEIAQGLGFEKVTLIVDQDKTNLQTLYASLGFELDGYVKFFGSDFLRMVQYLA